MAFAGSNVSQYVNMQSATVDIGGSTENLAPTGVRIYLDDGNFPSTGANGVWNWSGVPSGARGCLSLRPALYELINPTRYPAVASALDAFLTSAPAGPPSLLGLWHEASGDNESGTAQNCGPNNNEVCRGPGGIYSDYFASLDSNFPNQGGAHGLLTKAQAYVQGRVKALNQANPGSSNVKVGAIEVVSKTSTTDLGNTINIWMANNLDFYAGDVYDTKDATAVPGDLLTAFQTVVKGHMTNGVYPSISITETNSRYPGRRPFWFTAAWSWLKSNGHTSNQVCFLTFWHQMGAESGAWIPGDWATIDSLHGIFAESSP